MNMAAHVFSSLSAWLGWGRHLLMLGGQVCGGTPSTALGSALSLENGLQKVRSVSVIPHWERFCSRWGIWGL